jgi:hypothetical protein
VGKLTARGWSSKSPKISSGEASLFAKRCSQSHTQQWRLDVLKYYGGETHNLAFSVPIIGGTLVLDSSDPIRRRIQVEVGGGEAWEPEKSTSPLAPFGQHMNLYTRIDYGDGTWSPWLQMFSGPIQSTVFERPSLICTVEACDRAQQLEEYLHTKKKSYSKKSLYDALVLMASAALPETSGTYSVEAPNVTDQIIVRKFVAEEGQSRLDAANDLAAKYGYEVFFDWNSTYIIRKDITDDDDALWDPSEPGGDIGTVTNPVAVIRDGPGGNLIAMTTSVSREGAANGAFINLTAKRDKKLPGKDLFEQIYALADGAVAWGDAFGRLPIIQNRAVGTITESLKASTLTRAKKLLKRRKGLSKYIDFDALPIPYLEPDDKVRIVVAGQEEAHYVQRIEFDLAGGPMRVRTRTLAVDSPLAPQDPDNPPDPPDPPDRPDLPTGPTGPTGPPDPGATYAQKVLSMSPLWYLTFDNPDFSFDASGNNYSTNGYLYTVDVPGLYPVTSGNPGRARYFPGPPPEGSSPSMGLWATFGTTVFDPPITVPPGDNSFTFVAGIKPDTGGTIASDPQALYSISYASWAPDPPYPFVHHDFILCGLTPDGHPWLRLSVAMDEYIDIFGPDPLPGETHHVVYSFDKVFLNMKIYVDGVMVVGGNLGAPLGPTDWAGGGYTVGSCDDSYAYLEQRFYRGIMDDPALFAYVMTDAEVASLYDRWLHGEGY